MAIKTVTFEDKKNINTKPEIARINKVTDDDINQLKNVANTNANNNGDLSTLNTTDKSSLVNAINSISEIITNENGTAIKHNNGIMICLGSKSFENQSSVTSFGGALFRSNSIAFDDFPVPFTEIPNISFSCKILTGASNGILFNQINFPTLERPGRVSLVKESSTAITGTVTYTAIGKWK